MARPQKATDDQIFAAAYRVMQRVAPPDFTLSAIADEAGVTAGLLVQRFGSKRGLMVRLAELSAGASVGFIEGLRERYESPLAVLRAYADCMADLAASPEAFARNLAYLVDDLRDPDLRRHLETQARRTRTAIAKLLTEAVAQGELAKGANPKQLARTIETIIGGSMLTWATYREGTAVRWMRQDLDLVLAPFLKRRT
ncbi:MAG TPA: TetR family transcriptional regulator [Gemmatimonadaceae bacterium]|jgi:AcrR family transcriptional regulator|nr:TetR family transcriptional regulator [Gemmatimonadaceae bacterium]